MTPTYTFDYSLVFEVGCVRREAAGGVEHQTLAFGVDVILLGSNHSFITRASLLFSALVFNFGYNMRAGLRIGLIICRI